MSDMRASAAAEVAADLIRSAATLWAKRATILDGVTQQADRAEVRAADAAASAETAAGHDASAAARASEAAASRDAADESAGNAAASRDAVAADVAIATASASEASAGKTAAALSATQAAMSATGAAASAATASARAGEAAASRDEAAASAAIAAGLSYSMTIYNTAGVPSGIYYLCRATHTAGTHGRLHAEVISGSAGASVSFRVLVNDTPVLALRTVVLGTPLALAGLALAIPAGARIDVEISGAPGAIEFFMEIAK